MMQDGLKILFSVTFSKHVLSYRFYDRENENSENKQ
jgi:hypothetical protein